MSAQINATIDDLYAVRGKAELVNGEIVIMSPTGYTPSYGASEIFVSLRSYAKRTKQGIAVNDNNAFRVNLPHRETVGPDAAYYFGPNPGTKFFEGAPQFAVEVRSEGDYGPAAEQAMVDKRADYFAARTLVVWDVDLLGADVVRVYRATATTVPQIFRRGEIAEAEPAVPGWSMSVDDLFETA
jgi:Uma2 family endonuclease